MPLFVSEHDRDRNDAEGLYVEPSPHRPPALPTAERKRRLARYLFWEKLHRGGLSIALIALQADKPASTVADGIKIARRRRREQAELDTLMRVPKLSPIFGCRPHVPRQKRPGVPCQVCGDRITSDKLYCGADGCDRVSARNEKVLAAEKAAADAASAVEERKNAPRLKAGARKVNASVRLAEAS